LTFAKLGYYLETGNILPFFIELHQKHLNRFLFREIRGIGVNKTNLTAVVLRCPFKISSTAVAVYLHRPMQYICSEKPMRCPDKVTALHPLTHRIDFAHAPHCVFEGTLIVMRVCKLILYTPSL
jgi:hypothetical protein